MLCLVLSCGGNSIQQHIRANQLDHNPNRLCLCDVQPAMNSINPSMRNQTNKCITMKYPTHNTLIKKGSSSFPSPPPFHLPKADKSLDRHKIYSSTYCHTPRQLAQTSLQLPATPSLLLSRSKKERNSLPQNQRQLLTGQLPTWAYECTRNELKM